MSPPRVLYNPMKIVYFIDHLQADGGTQKMLVEIVKGLSVRGHNQAVQCFHYGWDQAISDKLERAGAEVRIMKPWEFRSGYGFISTYNWLKRNNFDVAVTMLFVADVFGSLLAAAARIKRLVRSIRSRNAHYSLIKWWLSGITLRPTDTVVVNSDRLIAVVAKQLKVDPATVIVIPNGIPNIPVGDRPFPDPILKDVQVPKDSLIVGSVGRLEWEKGYDVLIRAVSKIKDPPVSLIILGEGTQRRDLIKLAANLEIENRVHLPGYSDSVVEFLSLINVYVQPSRFEGMPNALLEAMVAGCPIVASSLDGIQELIEDGRNGWLFAPEDSDQLADLIVQALTDRLEAHERGKLAQQVVVENYSIERMLNSWDKVVRAEIDRGGSIH